MDVRNLTEANIKDAESMFDKMKELNPDLRYKTYKQDDQEKSLRIQVDELAEIVGKMELKLKHIFGGHVLINGQFVDVSKKI